MIKDPTLSDMVWLQGQLRTANPEADAFARRDVMDHNYRIARIVARLERAEVPTCDPAAPDPWSPGRHLHAIFAAHFNGGGWVEAPDWSDFDDEGQANWEALAQAIARHVKAASRAVELFQAVAASARQFRTYELHHRDKDTAEGRAKAEVNANLAARLEALLAEADPRGAIERGAGAHG